jgi:hypothetical protein
VVDINGICGCAREIFVEKMHVYYTLWIFVLFTATSCGLFSPEYETTQSDFNMIFKYGVGARNVLDTYTGTYTKDLVLDPPVTIALSLTHDEKNRIYHKMVEINFFGFPDTFSVIRDDEEAGFFMPFSSYYFNVTHKTTTKELVWEDKVFAEDDQATKLRELINVIREIVESKEAYKKLPPPTGGYL